MTNMSLLLAVYQILFYMYNSYIWSLKQKALGVMNENLATYCAQLYQGFKKFMYQGDNGVKS